jgi:hypothetical protein
MTKETLMKIFKAIAFLVLLSSIAYPQTKDLGLGAFSNENGAIKLAVDAGLVQQNLKNPYVMFVVYMAAAKENQSIVVPRDNVVMIYKGQEYKMPSIKELRSQYGAEIRDITFYRRLTKAGIESSWMRFYQYPANEDFFPPLTTHAPLPKDEAWIYNSVGFRTKCYFKNPGFQKGDKLILRVSDKKNPELMGEVEITLN